MTLSCSWVSWRTGTWTEKPCFSATASSRRWYQTLVALARAQGWMAPSAMVRFLLGMTRSGSSSIFTPRPVQSGQAPWGLLKLKLRGATSPRLTPQWTQAKCSE